MAASPPPPALAGVTHRWIDTGEVRLHVAEAGADTGEHLPVVLVHGWPQHWWCWREVIGPLAADRRVIAVDLRGFGWSEAPPSGYDKHRLADDLLALVRLETPGRVDVVGHDWGGWSGLLAAVQAPHRIRRTVAVAIPAPWTGLSPSWEVVRRLAYQPLAATPVGRAMQAAGRQPLLREVYRRAHARGGHLEARDEAAYLERFRWRARSRAGSAMYREFLVHEVPRLMRDQYCAGPPAGPVLLLPGEHDTAIPPAHVRAGLRADRPDVVCETVSGAGHFVPDEHGPWLADRVRRFLDADEATAGRGAA